MEPWNDHSLLPQIIFHASYYSAQDGGGADNDRHLKMGGTETGPGRKKMGSQRVKTGTQGNAAGPKRSVKGCRHSQVVN